MARKDCKVDRNLEIIRKRNAGYTLRELSDEYGVSYQRIHGIVSGFSDKKERYSQGTVNEIVYPGLRSWMTANRCPVSKLARLSGITYYRTRRLLNNISELRITDINAILGATNLTYEEAFWRKD